MQTPDISPLVKGAFVIIAVFMSIGQYSALEKWAREQAIAALEWKEPLPDFFAERGRHRARGRELRVTHDMGAVIHKGS